MTRLIWNDPGTKEFEAGVDHGVLYVGEQPGVAWPGLTSVEVEPDGGGAKSYYLDGEKYLLVSESEEYAATINAFTYPNLFTECDGSRTVRAGLKLSQQRRKTFGFSYRTMVGNDQDVEAGYKIHLVYNALASPSSRSHTTANDRPELTPFSWAITTKPPVVAGYKRTAHVEIDSRTTDSQVLGLLEESLYGNETEEPRLPAFAEIVEMYDAFFVFVVTDNGDGIFTISGPDDAILALDDILLQFTWPTVLEVDPDTYTIASG